MQGATMQRPPKSRPIRGCLTVVSAGAIFAAAAPAGAQTFWPQRSWSRESWTQQQSWQQQSWQQHSRQQHSWLYPPEVAFRAVVVVDDPSLQRRYWDPRFCDCACLPHRHLACPPRPAWR